MKKYNNFILENVSLSNKTVIEILKSLSKSKDNTDLINKIINNTDSKNRNILMNLVSSKADISLIDDILKYDIDLNHIDDFGNNVLFYCKSVKVFKKIYNHSKINTTLINKKDQTLLINLALKKIFNNEIYENLIRDGVDINHMEGINGDTLLSLSITKPIIINLLIKNNVDIKNLNREAKRNIIYTILYLYKIYEDKNIIDNLKLLIDNGFELKDYFYEEMISMLENSDIIDFSERLKDYLDPIRIFNSLNISSHNIVFLFSLLNVFKTPHFYNFLKNTVYGKTDRMKKFEEENPKLIKSIEFNL